MIAVVTACYLLYSLGIARLNAFTAHHPQAVPPILWVVLGGLSTIAYLLIIVYLLRLLARLTLTAKQEWLLFGASLLIFLAVNPIIWQIAVLLWKGTGFWELFGALSTDTRPMLVFMTQDIAPIFLILTGAFFGRLLARVVRERALLVPVGIVSGLIDLWGVYWGPVNAMSESAPVAVGSIGSAATVAAAVPDAALQHLSAPLLMLAQLTPPETIGIGDFVFLTFFLTCAYRLGFSAKRVMWGIFVGMLLASVIMALDGLTLFGHEVHIEYLPGLLFISGGVLLANLRAWKLTRSEWLMTAVPVGAILIVLGISVARTELAKPHTVTTQYTLTATSAEDVIHAALARIRTQQTTELRPLYGQFIFLQRPNGPQLVKMTVLVIGTKRQAIRRQVWEYAIISAPNKTRTQWMVAQQAATPPENALGLLHQLHQGADAALLRDAHGLPATAWRVSADAPTYAARAKGQRAFALLLYPEKYQWLDQRGKVLASGKYAKK